MKSSKIVKKLEKEGYSITFKKWAYWDNVPRVELGGFEFTIAETIYLKNNWLGINLNFIYNHVLEALELVKINNPILLKKIVQVPWEDWYYSQYLILNMDDYYKYKKEKYPYNEYWTVLQKLENEIE